MSLDIADRPSPNFDERAKAVPLNYIVLHYTGMPSAEAAMQRLTDPAAKVSAHYMIDEDGHITRLVDESKRAWHAGKSFWRGETDINSASIGIELVNPGHEFGYRPFPKAQIEALKILLKDIVRRHNMNPTIALLAHADIAPERKEDPGELFPWQELADEGLGLWPKPQAEDYAPFKNGEPTALLRAIGYACPDTNAERIVQKSLLAFQRRYLPDHLTGQPEQETIARLRALARAMGG